MTEFFQSRMGHTFFESTMPSLVRQLERLNKNLEKSLEKAPASPGLEGAATKIADVVESMISVVHATPGTLEASVATRVGMLMRDAEKLLERHFRGCKACPDCQDVPGFDGVGKRCQTCGGRAEVPIGTESRFKSHKIRCELP